LNAQQILQTDPAARSVVLWYSLQRSMDTDRKLRRRRKCEAILTAAFEQECGRGAYILLRSEQLVGTAIFVYAKASLLPSISRVEGASRKVSSCAFVLRLPSMALIFNLACRLVCEGCRAIRVVVGSEWTWTTLQFV
jgi:hypothetical protein